MSEKVAQEKSRGKKERSAVLYEHVINRKGTNLRQWRSVTITTAPIPADTRDTITKVKTHPSSPGASAKGKHATWMRNLRAGDGLILLVSLLCTPFSGPYRASFTCTPREGPSPNYCTGRKISSSEDDYVSDEQGHYEITTTPDYSRLVPCSLRPFSAFFLFVFSIVR